jgi:hypothetical protein
MSSFRRCSGAARRCGCCRRPPNADLLVTGDKDLLTIGAHEDVAIVTVAEALRRIGLAP